MYTFYYNNWLIEIFQILLFYFTFSFIFNNRFLVCVIGLGRFTFNFLSILFISFSSSFLFWFYKFFKTSFIFMLNFIFPYVNLWIIFFYWYYLPLLFWFDFIQSQSPLFLFNLFRYVLILNKDFIKIADY